jgi:shikimate dehydrogenase
VLGRPIAHSRSPVLHRAAYEALGLSGWTYDAIDCGVDELPALVAGAGPEWVGYSCTMPLKRAVLEVAGEVRPRAAAVGAGNTLIRSGDGWAADNTDVLGIVAALRERSVTPRRVAVLGAGGTAQAAVVALADLGLSAAAVLVRAPDRSGELLATASRAQVEIALRPLTAPLDDYDLVVSGLPPGAADLFAARPWRADQAVLDAVYEPWPTPLAAAVEEAGGTVVSGFDLLLHQAAAQVELMTGRPAPLAEMRAALARSR